MIKTINTRLLVMMKTQGSGLLLVVPDVARGKLQLGLAPINSNKC